MSNALIYVGTALQYNQNYRRYLEDTITKRVGGLDQTFFVEEDAERVLLDIQHMQEISSNLFIIVTEGMEFISKVFIEHTLDLVSEGSYTLSIGLCMINILDVRLEEVLPQIVLQEKYMQQLFFFYDSLSQMNTFESQLSRFEISYQKSSFINGVVTYMLKAKGDQQFKDLFLVVDEKFYEQTILGDDLSKHIVDCLIDKEMTITCAESCTGGMIASRLVNNSGISAIFEGSVVSYSNDVKSRLIGVSEQTLHRHGAVSESCVREMLTGVMHKFEADIALAVSGIAGPDGGTEEKPVGTIFIGVKSIVQGMKIEKLQLNGNRNHIQESTVLSVFKLLIQSHKSLFFKKVSKSLDM
ncbi:MAG: CinA family protein [Epsilonproteobacteria bacterium]|nr:CinA family protein [Campylobacterota bacterium]